ncbi:MAG: RDD family protein [Actinomycetia bacterium]|nr:RDD family protein [Actinomycetes bacterium]
MDQNTGSHVATDGELPGPLSRRLAAHIVDAFLLFVPLLALWVVALRRMPLPLATFTMNGLSVAYFVLMESMWGRTLGKRALRLRVRGTNGDLPTVKQALLRNLYLALGIIQGVLGSVLSLGVIVWIAVSISQDRISRQGVHDRFANETYVTLTPR